jgi:hypothetical protein
MVMETTVEDVFLKSL